MKVPRRTVTPGRTSAHAGRHKTTAATNGDHSVTKNVAANDTEPDASEGLAVSAASIRNGAMGSVTFGGSNIAYDPGTAYNCLAVGETATVVVGYTISDGHGGSSS